MKRVSLKKSMTICLVSALIASSMCTMAFAVEPSDTVSDNSVVVSEQSDEISVVSEVSKEESVGESSIEISGGTGESSKQVSTVEESSEIDLKELELKVNFGGTFAKKSFSNEKGYIDYSKVVVQLYTSDKSKLIKTFNITDNDLGSEYGCSDTKTMSIKVPSWKDGDSYKIVVSNLPSFYESSTQEFTVSRTAGSSDDRQYSIFDTDISLKLKDANCFIFLYDMNDKPISSVIDIVGYDAEDNSVYQKLGVRVGSDGVATLKLTDSSIKSLGISMEAPVNNESISGETIMSFDADVAINIEPMSLVVNTNIDLSETPVDDEGNPITNKAASITVNCDFKDKNDMTFFNHSDIILNLYKGSNLEGSFTVSKDEPSRTFTLVDGEKYTIKSEDSRNYVVTFDKDTFTASKGTVLNITAVPAHFVTIVNDKNEGAVCNVSVNGKEYKGKTKYIFAVNDLNSLTIKNLDTNDMYSIFVTDYENTTLDVKDGSVTESGYNGVSDNAEVSNNVNNEEIPKTGDTIPIILAIIGGIGLLFGTGYIYFKKKGSKLNESKK